MKKATNILINKVKSNISNLIVIASVIVTGAVTHLSLTNALASIEVLKSIGGF